MGTYSVKLLDKKISHPYYPYAVTHATGITMANGVYNMITGKHEGGIILFISGLSFSQLKREAEKRVEDYFLKNYFQK